MKFNPYHDEQGRFTTADNAVEPGTRAPSRPNTGVEVADNSDHSPTMKDASFLVTSPSSGESDHPKTKPVNEITNHGHDVPKDAVLLKAGDGSSFYAPPNADFNQVYAMGSSEGLLGAESNIGHFGRFDFQRDGDTFIHPYSDASNYAVGVYMAGAGYTWNETYMIANSFAQTMSSNAGAQAQQAWWQKGWDDATARTCPFSVAKLY